MRLQQLEIKGFKSFANETVINFREDVIGIVGPNGSGKSNIVDAIRWVLGEQKSRELRLDQMSSVIFNGTKDKKPGALASVSLTFQNTKNLLPTDYETVKITRVLYRSGESEYRLNGVTCRLKDITTLFLDTGIGSNSYAIIALGMVDDILTDKENARRRMFEQAAGISKYKVRKRETISKLNSTTEDLNRVEDLLFEIEGNLKTLEKQARRAKKYLQLKEDYKNGSINLALVRITVLKQQHKTLKNQLESEEDKKRENEISISSLEARLEKEKKVNLDKERSLSERQRELNAVIGNIRSMENDKKINAQKLQFVVQNSQKLEQDIRNAEVKLEQIKEDIDFYRTELNAEVRIEQESEEELKQAEQGLEAIKGKHGELKAGMDEKLLVQQKAEKVLFEIEKRKAVLSNQIQGYRSQLKRNDEDIIKRNKEVAHLKDQVMGFEEHESILKVQIEELQKAEEKRQEELQAVQKDQEEVQHQLSKVNRQLDANKNEKKLIKSMVENLEGFPESIRFLSNSKSWDAKAQLLSDLIYVDENYRVAVENYLEPYLNYYVVENKEAAYQAISLLGNAQQGKANFFLLDTFKDYEPTDFVMLGMKRAVDLVEVDEAYQNLCSYLLENVLVTDSDDLPEQLPGENYALLARSGRFIQKPNSVSGGSVGLFEGKKIGRKKSLEILEKKIKALNEQSETLKAKSRALKNREKDLKQKSYSVTVQKEKDALNKVTQGKITVQARLENFEAFIQTANNKKEEIQGAIAEIETEERALNRELLEQEEQVDQIKEEIATMDGSFKAVADELSRASSNFNQKKIDFVRQQNKVGTLRRELGYHEDHLKDTESKLEDSRQKIKQNAAEREEVNNLLEELEADLIVAYQARKEKEKDLNESEQLYFDARAGINEIEESLRKANRIQQECQARINQLTEQFNDVKYKISAIAQRLQIEFNLNINALINQAAPEGIDEIELEMKMEKIKKRLDGYGEINPMAVEAFDEMKERYDSITQQRDDILQAQESLMNTIKEIEDTATAQFLDAFDKARIYFINVFRSLFTQDDNCDLILVDPENPLDSKIEIVAKPKGKRPQTINQLSGGEKTLTATALLFALYLLKPAPFCIFDEVDAPLDDANITKFNKIIKKFSKDSQFVIITHNKLTMAAVDTIYGVYMSEPGISGVSPVDFREFDHVLSFEKGVE